MQYGLTRKQRDVFDFVKAACENGVPPSVEEIAAFIGSPGAKSNAQRYLNSLENRGYIKRLPFRARSIVICKP